MGYYPETRRGLLGVIERKICGVVGRAPIASNCQIPGLRELLIAAGLPERHGIFVEVGAYDGESYSNTSFLADQGWRGVYVEPVARHCRRIARRHFLNNVTILQKAVGAIAGPREIYVMGGLTTTTPATVAAYRNIPWTKSAWAARENQSVDTITLTELFKRAAVPTGFDLLVVDVEGAEEEIMIQLIESDFRPKVAIVELVDDHPDFAVYPELRESHVRARAQIAAAGYRTVFRDTINTVFVRR